MARTTTKRTVRPTADKERASPSLPGSEIVPSWDQIVAETHAPLKRGRPLKEHAPDALVTINVQVRGDLKSQLQARAAVGNRTLSQEVTMILEDALSGQDALNRREYGELGGHWATTVGLLVEILDRIAGKVNALHPVNTLADETLTGFTNTIDALRNGDKATAIAIARKLFERGITDE